MTDPRCTKLADLLVNYSVAVKPHEKVMIRSTSLAAPLLKQVYRKVLEAGGLPFVLINLPELESVFFKIASDEQLQFIPDGYRQALETEDVQIDLVGDENTRALTNIDPSRMVLRSQAFEPIMKTFMERSANGSLRWTLALFPTNAHAQDADMSLDDYEDFVYQACMPDMNDPIGYWLQVSAQQQRIVEWLKGKNQVHITAPGTELTLSVAGRSFVNCDCHKNVPDGEVFTGPVEDSINGHVLFSFPAIISGRQVEGVELWFENGKVVKACAEKNEDFLLKTLDTDEGARRVGEFAIGTNLGIQRFTGEILFDEKIGGSFHMALGAGYPETGSVNQSAIHWDMICDMRQGGEIRIDDELFYRDGQFMID